MLNLAIELLEFHQQFAQGLRHRMGNEGECRCQPPRHMKQSALLVLSGFRVWADSARPPMYCLARHRDEFCGVPPEAISNWSTSSSFNGLSASSFFFSITYFQPSPLPGLR